MAEAKKEIKEIKELKDITKEKFYLTKKIRETGYSNSNFNILIDFERDFNGNRRSRYASTGTIVNGEFKSDGVDYLEGLTSEQVYQLSIAKIIKLKKEQYPYFLNHLNSINREIEDE